MQKRFLIGIGLLALAALLISYRGRIVGYTAEKWEKRQLPEAQSYEEVVSPSASPHDDVLRNPSQSPSPDLRPSSPGGRGEGEGLGGGDLALPLEFNLAVPFTSQAPFAVWDALHKEACEEASVIMVDAFYKGRTFSPTRADAEIMAVVNWEKQTLGHWEDTTAQESARILREKYGYKNVRVVANPTIDDIKREVAKGHPVIVPVAGRLLGNRYFTPPGPTYHMLVVRGWTKAGMIITNDPGTKRGGGYLYRPDVLMNAMHDWTGSDDTIMQGEKVMIVVE